MAGCLCIAPQQRLGTCLELSSSYLAKKRQTCLDNQPHQRLLLHSRHGTGRLLWTLAVRIAALARVTMPEIFI